MRTSVHILVTCTKRKTRDPKPKLMMRTVADGPVERRIVTWIKRLTIATDSLLPAHDLYAGDHWRVARELPVLARRQGFSRATLWIVSAAYGLIEADTL